MIKATLTKEISIETPNHIGVAAKVTQLIASDAKANIRSAWASGTNGHGHFSLITDHNQKALDVLKKEFPKTQEREVIVLEVLNEKGQIADITAQISKADLSIDYLYTTLFDDNPAIILSTNNNKKALDLLNHH